MQREVLKPKSEEEKARERLRERSGFKTNTFVEEQQRKQDLIEQEQKLERQRQKGKQKETKPIIETIKEITGKLENIAETAQEVKTLRRSGRKETQEQRDKVEALQEMNKQDIETRQKIFEKQMEDRYKKLGISGKDPAEAARILRERKERQRIQGEANAAAEKAAKSFQANEDIESLRQRVVQKPNILSRIYGSASDLENKIRDLYAYLDDYRIYLNNRVGVKEKAILYGLGVAIALDFVQSRISGETVLMKIVRSPVRLYNYIQGIEENSENFYFKDLDGARIYPNMILEKPNIETDTYLEPAYDEFDAADVAENLFEGNIVGSQTNRLANGLDLNPIRESNFSINNMRVNPVREFPESPVLPSQPGTIPEGTKYTLNNLMSEFPISGVDPEDKAYREMVLRLGRLYADVTSGARPDPTGAAGYIEPIQREYVEPKTMMLNNIVHRAPPHNIDIEQKQETLFNIPNKTVMDPQTLINRMKAKKGTKFTNIVGPARSTRESSLVESKRLER